MRASVISALGFAAFAVAADVASYISQEGPIARAGMLANIGPDGDQASTLGANAGVVIASPSTDNPNYLYTWVRDSSLVFKTIIDQYTLGLDDSYRDLIDAFVAAEGQLQQLTNPSGSVSSGGLGEPKFYVNITAFEDSWGRPQRDGPALRSTALITYANWLADNSNTTFAKDTLWPMIKLDLDYVSDSWNQTTFDLWEEIQSSSFFTTAVQHRALREGISLASKLGETVSGWSTQADDVLCFLQSYWNNAGSYVTANTGGGRSGIDANTVLASIHTFDKDAGCDAVTFQPCSDVALANLKTYVDSFRGIYGLNDNANINDSVATGRYPEDVFYGGNPWYLTTFAVAEQLYDALTVWDSQKSIDVTPTSLPFFQQFGDNIATGTYDSSSDTYTLFMDNIKTFADGFVSVNAQYTPSNGSLSEEYSRDDGDPTSAYDLTWSYASAVTVFEAWNSTAFASWGASGLSVASSCGGVPSISTVSVTFNVNATTNEGENIYIAGDADQLKAWSPTNAIELSSKNYPTWSGVIDLPESSTISYKYLKKNAAGTVTWESDPNRSLTTKSSGSQSVADSWQS